MDREQRRRRGLEGFNALTGTHENLVNAGVIDPTKVVRSALQNAASIASLLLTTEALVSDISEESEVPAGISGELVLRVASGEPLSLSQ